MVNQYEYSRNGNGLTLLDRKIGRDIYLTGEEASELLNRFTVKEIKGEWFQVQKIIEDYFNVLGGRII